MKLLILSAILLLSSCLPTRAEEKKPMVEFKNTSNVTYYCSEYQYSECGMILSNCMVNGRPARHIYCVQELVVW